MFFPDTKIQTIYNEYSTSDKPIDNIANLNTIQNTNGRSIQKIK